MHIRSKFDGGKQINRSQSGAWQGRCAGAGLRQNLGAEWGPEVWQKVTGRAANSVFTVASRTNCKQLENDKKRKATDQAKSSRRATKYKKTNDNSTQARHDYARHDDGPGVKEVVSDIPHSSATPKHAHTIPFPPLPKKNTKTSCRKSTLMHNHITTLHYFATELHNKPGRVVDAHSQQV